MIGGECLIIRGNFRAWRSYHRVQENRVMDKFRSKQIVKTFLSQFKRFSLDYLEKNHVDLVVLNTEDYFDQFSWMIETLVLTVISDASDWKRLLKKINLKITYHFSLRNTPYIYK